VKAGSQPVWDRLELRLIRMWTIGLASFDSLFNVDWGERVLERQSDRWRARLVQLQEEVDRLEVERSRVQSQAEALALHAATIYLGGRSLARHELRFDPADPHEEEMLDATVNLLVNSRLAAIEDREAEPGHHIYYLEPDWAAIRARLARAMETAEPQAAEMYRESLAFIDETFLDSGRGSSPLRSPLASE
jgi:predicted O-linked N-acetylglucosamine transferase (SPINDLY family)